MRLFRRSVGHALVVGGLHCAEKPAASQVTYSLVPFVGLSVLSELLVVNNLDVVDDCIVQGLRRSTLCANVTWNTCLLEFTVQGSITHGSSTGFFDEPRSVDFEPGHPVRSP